MANNRVDYIINLKDFFSKGIKSATNETEKLNKSVNALKSGFQTLVAGYVVKEIVDATAAMEALRNKLNFAGGSVQQGAADFEWLTQKTGELGLDLQVAANAFGSFESAARGTSIQGQAVRDIFEGVGMASTVMHLSAEQSEGAFRALEQMMSKGTVQAEELRGQLGERITGAFQIAARAMKMSTAELNKFMADGKLMAEDFLPKFAAQLKIEFAGGVKVAGQSLAASMQKMNTAVFQLKATLGEMFLPVIQGVLSALISLADVIERHKVLFTFLITAFGTLIGLITAYKSALLLAEAAQWALNTATAFFEGLTGVGVLMIAAAGAAALAVGLWRAKEAQDGLNASMSSGISSAVNPMGQPATATANTTKSTKKTGTSLSAVETRQPQNFYIDIGNLIEQLSVNTTNLRESATAIKAEVTKAMIGAVNDFQLMAVK